MAYSNLSFYPFTSIQYTSIYLSIYLHLFLITRRGWWKNWGLTRTPSSLSCHPTAPPASPFNLPLGTQVDTKFFFFFKTKYVTQATAYYLLWSQLYKPLFFLPPETGDAWEKNKQNIQTEECLYEIIVIVMSVKWMNKKIIEGQRIRKKTSWNNSNTVLVIQRRGRVVTDYKNWPKFCLVLYN